MPLKTCKEGDKPGYKWGDAGKCYTYPAGDPSAQKEAKKKAIKQGIAIEGPDKFKKEVGMETKPAVDTEKTREHYTDQADTVPPDDGTPPGERNDVTPHRDDDVDNYTILELVREVEQDNQLEKLKSHLRYDEDTAISRFEGGE